MERYCSQSLKVNFPNKIFLGSEYFIDVPFNTGGFVSKIRIVLDFPINNTLRENIVNEAEIVNTNEILYGEFMYIENLLNTKIEKQQKLTDLVSNKRVYIDLPFLSIKKIFFNKINLRILFNQNNLITTELNGYLLVDYVVLDTLPKFPFFQRIRQIEKLPLIVYNSEYITIDTYIPGPVYELFFTVRDITTNQYVDAIDNVSLTINDIERFNLSGYYLRYIEPFKRRKKVSFDVPLYTYSFCLDPLNYEVPNGQTHLSEKQRFKIKLFKNQSTYEITIWALSYNFYYAKSKDDDVKPVFNSKEMILNVSTIPVTNYSTIPSFKISYTNINNNISVYYSSNIEVNISNIYSNISNLQIQTLQNEIKYNSIDSTSKSYYSNVVFNANGFKDTPCNFVFNGSEVMKNFIQKEEGLNYLFIQDNPIIKIDGGQRFNVVSNYTTLNNTNLGIETIKDFYIDQYKNFIVKTSSNIYKYTQSLDTILYTFTTSDVEIGEISTYFGNDIIPFTFTNTNGSISNILTSPMYQGIIYNTNTQKYNNIYCDNSKVSIHVAKIDENLNTYVSGVTSGTGNIIISNKYTISKGSGKKAFMCCFDSNGEFKYIIICDNTDDTVLTNVEKTSNNLTIFTCYSTSSSTLYDVNKTYTPISTSDTLNSFMIDSNGNYTLKNMKIENFTSLPVLNKCFIDLFDNYYISYNDTNSGYVTFKFDKFNNIKYYLNVTGNETCNIFLEPVTTNLYISCTNFTGSRDLMNVYTNGTQTLATNVPSTKTIILCFDSNGIYTNYSTPTSNLFDLINTEKLTYFTPLYDSSYFSNTYSQQLSYENYFWNTFITNASVRDIRFVNSNVYVAGVSGPSSSNIYNTNGLSSNIIYPASSTGNGYIVKFNSNGVSQWSVRYSPFSVPDFVSVTVDSDDNVYGTGLNFTGAGNLKFYDSTDTLYSKEIPDQQGFLVKYTPNGNIDWLCNLSGDYNQVNTRFVRCDNQSNIYITGDQNGYVTVYSKDDTESLTSNYDYGRMFMAKYSSDGFPLWLTYITDYYGSGTGGISFDSSNSVYVCGVCGNPTGTIYTQFPSSPTITYEYNATMTTTAYTIKYDSLGTVQFYVYIRSSSDYVNLDFGNRFISTTVDSSSNFYMCGTFASGFGLTTSANVYNSGNTLSPVWINGTSTGVDSCGYVVKFDSSGIAQWSITINGNVNLEESKSIITDSSNNVYIAGYKSTLASNIYNADNVLSSLIIPTTQSSSAFLVKFNSSGIAQWVVYIDGQLNDLSYALTIDNSENILFSGHYAGSNVKIYESNGGTYNLFKSLIGGNNVGFCIKIDQNGFLVPV